MTPQDAASILPRKSFDCEVKALDESTGSFELYAACFGNVDRQGDMIEPGAFQNLPEFISDGWIALNHDQAGLPIAVIDTAEQDAKGLKVTGRFHTHEKAQSCRAVIVERMAAGKRVLCSIGYLVPVDGERYERLNGQNVRHISKLAVYEASIVNLPANPLADVQSVKSITSFDLDGFEQPESEEEMSEQTVVEAIKQALGLSTKAGRKMSGATLERMKGFAKAMDEHGDKCMSHAKSMNDQCKALKGYGQAHKDMASEFHKELKNFEAGQQQEVDEDNDGDVAEEEAKAKAAPKPEPDEDDKKPPFKAKEDTEEEKTKKAYIDQLKRRALAGRRFQQCP